MIVGWTGLPGASKTTTLAATAIEVLYRNKKLNQRREVEYMEDSESYYQKYKQEKYVPRILWSNIQFSPDVESEFPGQIKYWHDVEQLTRLRDCDVVIDEAMVYFDNRSWEHLSLDVRRWLAQHRKFGIEIYFTAQEFSQVDISFRRLVSDLFYLTKLIGSRDISATLPPPKHVWGVTIKQAIDPVSYEENKKSRIGLPTFGFITRGSTKVFDTRQEIKSSKFPPLKHIERQCGDAGCTFHKLIHV